MNIIIVQLFIVRSVEIMFVSNYKYPWYNLTPKVRIFFRTEQSRSFFEIKGFYLPSTIIYSRLQNVFEMDLYEYVR